MKFLQVMAVAAVAMFIVASPAQAKRCVHNTIDVNTAYNIHICVDPRFASKFQKFFVLLKTTGAKVTDIGCQAFGHAPGSNHIGGGACDVNQRSKNRTIPAMYHAGALIREAGLYDGCSFHDCGHIEAMRGLGNYGGRRYASATFSARRHHRRYERVAQASPSYMTRFGAGQ